MTFNFYFGIIYIVIAISSLILWYKREKSNVSHVNISNVSFNRLYTIILPIAVIVLGTIIRLYRIGSIPLGLHQDEASIGYEAYILSVFGVDRDGNHLPIYPITYGSGGGSPLMIYLNVLTTYLFGAGVTTLRMLPAILGSLTLPIFFLLIRFMSKDSVKNNANLSLIQINGEFVWLPLVGLCVLTFCPWHVMLSRWSLDSNTAPFFICAAMLLFVLGAYTQKDSTSFRNIETLFSSKDSKKRRSLKASVPSATVFFALSAILYSLCLYDYGAATIIIPIHLIIISVYCLKTGRMTGFQMSLGILLFAIFSLPLGLFYAVNYFGLPAIATPLFTITTFTAKRSIFVSGSGFLGSIIVNLVTIIKNLSIGNAEEQIVNLIPGFPPLFAFTFPVTIAGIVVSAINLKRGKFSDVIMFSLFLPAFIFGLFIEEDITRMVIIFIPAIYFLTVGYIFVVSEFISIEKNAANKSVKYLAIVTKAIAPALFFVGAAIFARAYFTEYNGLNAEAFMPGYGEACAYANEAAGDDRKVISTYEHLAAPFMIALYYTKTSPYEFCETVHYKDPEAEFRIADSFGKWTFGLPDDFEGMISEYKKDGTVLILHSSEIDKYGFDENPDFELHYFESFAVVEALNKQ